MGLKIKTQKHGEIPVIKIIGEAVGRDVAKISKKLDSYLNSADPVIAVDLSETYVIDSYGLGVFVFSWKQFASQKKQLVFVNPQGFVKNLFDGTNLTKIINIVDSLDSL
jgi:anti-anti-sigma factor